jgi:glycosyltransferase involved in cell wall biosynthesis
MTVSVVINNFNYGRFIRAAIQSVLSQTYPHVELIVVDDGSTDNSREVITRYGNRLTTLFKQNEGQPSAFNAGFLASSGDIVIFLDADDLLLPSAAEMCVEVATASMSKIHWPMLEIDEAGVRSGVLVPAEPLPSGDLLPLTMCRGPWSYVSPPTSGNAWHRSFLEKVLPVPRWSDVDQLGGDAYLIDLAPLFGQIGRIDEPQSCYRVHESNNSGPSSTAKAARYLRRHELRCSVLASVMSAQGLRPDLAAWDTRQNPHYAWMHKILAMQAAVLEVVRAGEPFILVDQEVLQGELPPGYRPISFLERDGRYWGPPENDTQAIEELLRLRAHGARAIVFVSEAFWWLEHYDEFARYLRSTYRTVADSPCVVAFDIGG